MYTYQNSKGNTIQWDDELSSFYMKDSVNPCWKLDVTDDSESCFYEEKGLHKCNADSISMYDDPDGIYNPIEDRAVFCTFVMIDNKITHLVKWSKQCVQVTDPSELNKNYAVKVSLWEENNPLPSWAYSILYNYYNLKGISFPENLNLQGVNEQINAISEETLKAESRDFFLQPPGNWITLVKFPSLFTTKEENKLTAGSGIDLSHPIL